MPSPLVKEFESPVAVTTMVANTTAGRYVFGTGPAATGTDPVPSRTAKVCYITNLDIAVPLYVLINPPSGTNASPTNFDRKIPSAADAVQEAHDLTAGGAIAIRSLSVWGPTGIATTDIVVRGITL